MDPNLIHRLRAQNTHDDDTEDVTDEPSGLGMEEPHQEPTQEEPDLSKLEPEHLGKPDPLELVWTQRCAALANIDPRKNKGMANLWEEELARVHKVAKLRLKASATVVNAARAHNHANQGESYRLAAEVSRSILLALDELAPELSTWLKARVATLIEEEEEERARARSKSKQRKGKAQADSQADSQADDSQVKT